MKILHLADLHIGKLLNGYSLLGEQEKVLKQVLSVIDEKKAEVVVISGDIYDRSIPPKEAMLLYNQFLRKVLIDRNIPVLAISGNHDSAERLEAGNALMEQVHYYIEGIFKKETKRVTIEDDDGEVDFYLIPFADVAQVRALLEDDEIRSFDDAMKKTVEHIVLRKGIRSVVLVHCYAVSESEEHEEEKIDSQKPLSIGGKEFVDAKCFDKFDYTALGHLHRRQKVGTDKVHYPGTLLKYSFSEEKHQKVILLVDLKGDGSVVMEEVPVELEKNVRTIEGRFEDIMEQAPEDLHREDFVRFILEDEDMVQDAMGRLKQYYPNAMELRYVFREKEISQILSKTADRKHTVSEMAELFYQENYEEEMSVALKEEVSEILKELEGEEDETN